MTFILIQGEPGSGPRIGSGYGHVDDAFIAAEVHCRRTHQAVNVHALDGDAVGEIVGRYIFDASATFRRQVVLVGDDRPDAPPSTCEAPYPTCIGSPTIAACAARGYCNRQRACND